MIPSLLFFIVDEANLTITESIFLRDGGIDDGDEIPLQKYIEVVIDWCHPAISAIVTAEVLSALYLPRVVW